MATKEGSSSGTKTTVRARRKGPGSLGETVATWKKLASNTRLLLADTSPQLATDLALFEEMIAKVEGSMAEQDILSGRATILVRPRKQDVASTRLVRNRVAVRDGQVAHGERLRWEGSARAGRAGGGVGAPPAVPPGPVLAGPLFQRP